MRFRRPIYRYLFYAAWLAVVGGVITLLVSANSKAKTRTCKGVVISINNDGEKIYVEKEDVLKNIEQAAGGSILKKHTGSIHLAHLEKALEKNPWIRDVELYFDTKDVLHVSVSERVPVARMFTTAGTSFYIDSVGYQLPLLEKYNAKLPVVTGFSAAKKYSRADSALLQQTKEVVQAISADAFWNAQVGQIDITPDKKFELIPVIGSHVIRLGTGYGAGEKLQKLMVFYKQVLPRAGFAKYSVLDVQFEGQVVALKKGPVSKVDSIQLQKNIQELLQKKLAEQEPDDAVPAAVSVPVLSNGDFDVEPEKKDTVAQKPVREGSTTPQTAVPAKSTDSVKNQKAIQLTAKKKTNEPTSKPVVKPSTEKGQVVTKPKAVMQPKVENDY